LLCLLIFCISLSYSLKWEGVNALGHPVIRTFRVIKSPALGNKFTFTIRATQRPVDGDGHKVKVANALEFTFSVVGLPHYVVRHFERSADTIESGAVRHGLRKLVEYVPSSPTAGYTPGVQNITQIRYFWKGSGSAWSQLSVTQSTSATGGNVYAVCSTNDIGVTFCFYVADIWSQLTVNGSVFAIDPNSIRHTLDISKFPWLGTNTQLALKVHFEAKSRVVSLNDTSFLDPNEDALDLSDPSDTKKPIASWDKFVNVTGAGCSATAPVLRSVIWTTDIASDADVNIETALTQWTGEITLNLVLRTVYFSFLTDCNQPTDIYWDPEIGFAIIGNFGSFVFPSLSLLFFVLLSLLF